jgi:protein-S-isoprenylcysteine O-methyltransferase Ste14
MHIWFFISLFCFVAITPIYFLSVEHLKLQERYGKERGEKIGEICGIISGWGFFLFWFGIWILPQARFTFPIFQNLSVLISIIDFSIPVLHCMIFTPFFVAGAWLGIRGVQAITLKAAETHRTEKIITQGVYSIVRHPQYLGGLLAHVGIAFLLSAWYSLLSTPIVVVLVYLISRKEEEELIKEFGDEYEEYKKRVPMLVPRLGI